MTYYINTSDKYIVYETGVWVVDANTPEEAIKKHNEGESEYHDTINTDYGDCLSSKIYSIEDEHGNQIEYD